jgi:hypothetical protein
MELESGNFVEIWHNIMLIGVIAMGAAAIITLLFYHLKVSLVKTQKGKHDYINEFEIKRYKLVFIFLGLSAAFFISMYGEAEITEPGVAFFVRVFFSIAGATLIIYISSLVLDYYYPTILNGKLRKLRFMPRTSATGGKMKLLSEDEEDVHLNEGMQAEENIFSIDYDVWIDEATKEIKIEKYQGHLISLQCNNCGFYTMRVKQEEIIEKNEDGSPKELLKHYQCSYCKNVRATQFSVSRKESEDYKLVKPKHKRSSKNIEFIKIDIRSTTGTKKSFEFNSVSEAQKFLDEFDFNKVI